MKPKRLFLKVPGTFWCQILFLFAVMLIFAPHLTAEDDINGRLMHAVLGKDKSLVVRMLDRGADPNMVSKAGVPLLLLAVDIGDLEIVRILIDHDANIHAINEDYDSAIKRAIDADRFDVLQFLLKQGADPNISYNYDDRTMLMEAAARGQRFNVQLLLSNGADVNAVDYMANSALIIAAEQGHVKIVQTLINHGADLSIINLNGWTAMSLAEAKGHDEVVAVIKRKDDSLLGRERMKKLKRRSY